MVSQRTHAARLLTAPVLAMGVMLTIGLVAPDVSSAAPVAFGKATQSPLVINKVSGPFTSPLVLTTTGGSDGGVVTFAEFTGGTAGGCAVTVGGSLTAASAGTCDVQATMVGDAQFKPVLSAITAINFTLNQSALKITNVSGPWSGPLNLTTTGGSDGGAVTFVTNTGGNATGCAVTPAGSLTATSAGTCLVTATMAGNATYSPVSSVITTITFQKAAQAALTITPQVGPFGSPLALSTTGGSDSGLVIYALDAGGTATGCAVTPAGSLTATSVGTCFVTATMADNANYHAVSSPITSIAFTLNAQAPLIITPDTGPFNAALALTATGGSDAKAITFTLDAGGTAANCAVTAAGSLTASSAGTCMVTATKAGDATYSAVSSVVTSITFTSLAQAALSINNTTGPWSSPLTLKTTGGTDNGAVTYVLNAGGSATGCAVTAAGSLTATSVGTCFVTATMAGNPTYGPVSSSSTTITFGKAPQATLTVNPATGPYSAPLTLGTTGGTVDKSVAYVLDAGGTAMGCAVTSPGSATATSAGTCFVQAIMAGNANYFAVVSPIAAVTFTTLPQAPLSINAATGPWTAALALATTGGSDAGAVSYALDAGGTATDCAVTGTGSLTATSSGTCNVTATMAGSVTYSSVSSAVTAISFTAIAQAALNITAATGPWSAPLVLATTGGSDAGAVSYVLNAGGTATGCAVTAAGSLTATSAGTCDVTATMAANAKYLAVSSAATAIAFTRSAQSALTINKVTGPWSAPLTLATTGGTTGGAVTYTDDAGGTASGCAVTAAGSLSATSAGTCFVTATMSGNDNYLMVSSASTAVTFAPSAQAPLILTSTAGTYGTSLALTVAGGSGTGAVSYAVTNAGTAGCTVVGSVLSANSAGACTVTATKAADANYKSISSSETTVTIAQAATTTEASREGPLWNSLSATLLSANGAPLVGQLITFSSGNGTVIGTAVTNAEGVATYSQTVVGLLGGIYIASFAGNVDYLGSSGSAPL